MLENFDLTTFWVRQGNIRRERDNQFYLAQMRDLLKSKSGPIRSLARIELGRIGQLTEQERKVAI